MPRTACRTERTPTPVPTLNPPKFLPAALESADRCIDHTFVSGGARDPSPSHASRSEPMNPMRSLLLWSVLGAIGFAGVPGCGDNSQATAEDTGEGGRPVRDTGGQNPEDDADPGDDPAPSDADEPADGDDDALVPDSSDPPDVVDSGTTADTPPPDPDIDPVTPGSDDCEENEKFPSNLGCEYWAVDLPQDRGNSVGGDGRGGAEAQTWAVVVSNPSNSPADVSVYAAADLATPIRTVTVPTGGLQIIEMPRDDLYATSITDNSFRIVSNRPIAAHQFNPLNNVAVQSNDASLLFPVNALTGSYRILSYRTRVTWYAAATIVAVAEGDTTVTVVSPDEIYSPEDEEVSEEGVIEGWDDRSPRTFTLRQGQVLNLSTRFSTDLSGMSIEADQPVAVFSSAAGIYIPNATGTSDHIEHQMLPVQAWRDRYAGVPFAPRGTVPDYFRVIVANDGTVITSSTPVNGGGWSAGTITLNAGQWTEFASTQAFELTASGPIQVAHYMAGSQAAGVPQTCTSRAGQLGLGDPALTILVPSQQWRTSYTILIPNGYTEDYISMVGPLGTTVGVSGTDGVSDNVTLSQPVDGTSLGFARYAVPRADGGGTTRSNVITLTSSTPFGSEVFGWSCAVSYAYPGGLNLENAE